MFYEHMIFYGYLLHKIIHIYLIYHTREKAISIEHIYCVVQRYYVIECVVIPKQKLFDFFFYYFVYSE